MSNILRFGKVEIRRQERLIVVDDEPVKIGGRALDLLLALLDHRERVVSKNELLDLVWPGVVVEENNLQVQMSAIRKLLGPNAISTIPGRGYKFTLIPTGELADESAPLPATIDDRPTHDAPTTNLPASVPVIYGRRSDEAQVAALLQQHRVLSIVGAGGIGKTRLALAVAARWRNDYADGVWWVDLSKFSQGALVASEVARVLGIALSANRPAAEVVADALRPLSLLLVLDNCEHLLEAVATLVDAISLDAPRVALLSTTQEPLRTSTEHLYRLDVLSLAASSALADVADSGAAQLFIARAKATDPRFELNAGNAAAVADICKRLDGMPLALELAAARISLLGLEGLRSRLDERFEILTGGSRFVLRRHQTLRAALDFSHALLTEQEQSVFRRLGVFAGSFAVENACEVALDDGFESWTTLDCLGTLVDKSVVVAEAGGTVRLRLLETTRAYALEKLGDAGETMQFLRRHLHEMVNTFARALDDYWVMADAMWLARYEPELDNLRAAVTFALKHDPQCAVVLMGDSRPLWLLLALQPEAASYCEAALRHVTAATPAQAAGRLWLSVATMGHNTWPKRALEAAAASVELLRAAGDVKPLAVALLAFAGGGQGLKTDVQLAAFEELRRLTDPRWPGRLRAVLPMTSARVHRGAERFAESLREYASAAEIAAECGMENWELAALSNVGDVAMIMGDLDRAAETLRTTALRLSGSRDQLFFAFATSALATALLLQSDATGARAALMPAFPLIVRFDIGARYACTAALLAAQEGRWSAAAHILGYGEAEYERHEMDARDPAEAHARERALQLLTQHAHATEVDAWMTKGRLLSVARAFELASALTP